RCPTRSEQSSGSMKRPPLGGLFALWRKERMKFRGTLVACAAKHGNAAPSHHISRTAREPDIMAIATADQATNDTFFNTSLEEVDPEIFGAIRNELGRQRHEIELIASENIVSRAVLEAQGSIMTNKYAEGYP